MSYTISGSSEFVVFLLFTSPFTRILDGHGVRVSTTANTKDLREEQKSNQEEEKKRDWEERMLNQRIALQAQVVHCRLQDWGPSNPRCLPEWRPKKGLEGRAIISCYTCRLQPVRIET
jgi:hypothetical protein